MTNDAGAEIVSTFLSTVSYKLKLSYSQKLTKERNIVIKNKNTGTHKAHLELGRIVH